MIFVLYYIYIYIYIFIYIYIYVYDCIVFYDTLNNNADCNLVQIEIWFAVILSIHLYYIT